MAPCTPVAMACWRPGHWARSRNWPRSRTLCSRNQGYYNHLARALLERQGQIAQCIQLVEGKKQAETKKVVASQKLLETNSDVEAQRSSVMLIRPVDAYSLLRFKGAT